MRKRLRLSWASFKALARVLWPFFQGDKRHIAWRFVGFLLGMLILVNIIAVLQSYIARDFINALAEKNGPEFYRLTIYYLLALAAATGVATMYRFTEERLALAWREWLTADLISRYFGNRNYYRLRSVSDIDNPDQRIAEDVRNVTATTLSLFLIVLNSVITLIAFIGVVAAISINLVWTLLFYTIFGTYLTLRIGRKLVRIHNRQYAREANFRYGLVRVRDNAESIAFFRGERREKLDLGFRFRDLVRNTRFLISWNRNLGFFTTGYSNFSLILPILVIAPAYLAGEFTTGIGTVTQAAGAFSQVLAATSVLIAQFERISSYVAGVSRLDSLWGEIGGERDEDEPEITIEEGAKLKLQDLTIIPPGSTRELVRNLNLVLKPGNGVLIMGPSGAGKSSILRTIAGLWNAGHGAIQRPNHRDMMFLPQKPYMPTGSLRAQLLYPYRERQEIDKQLNKVMSKVNLAEIVERVDGKFDTTIDWSNVLSLGEQQRISFARLFLKEPSIAFLDEATSALDEENETALYTILQKSKLSYVSVGHRSSLIKYHNHVLVLDGEGGWKLVEAKELEAA